MNGMNVSLSYAFLIADVTYAQIVVLWVGNDLIMIEF